MFDHLIKELERLGGETSIAIPIETDADGYDDKECPAENCLFGFKIHAEDWKNIVRDEEVFCASCRHAAPAKSWFTRDQVAQMEEHATNFLQGRINEAMRQDAHAWNARQPRNTFVSITLKVEGGSEAILLPISAAEPMRLQAQCESCGCRYSYIGAAFFCPSCGANSARHTFAQTLSGVRVAARSGVVLREALDKDAAEVLARTLLEKGLQDGVMSFQRLCERLMEQYAPSTSVRRNAFQSLDAGSAIWHKCTGAGYEDLIDGSKLGTLRVYFQQRHLLSHSQGIVDADYITRSGDGKYLEGQRLTLREADVLQFVDLIEELGNKLIDRATRP